MCARPLLCDFIISVACPVWSVCLVTLEACYSPKHVYDILGLKWAALFPPERLCPFMTTDYRFIWESQEDPEKVFPYPFLFASVFAVPQRNAVLH